jgi:uncharacterized protein (TIGR04255 family)
MPRSLSKQVKPKTGARRKYKTPPIVEATCEFQFVPTDDWNIAYSGLFLEKVKHRYGGKPREQRLLQVEAKGAPATTPESSQAMSMREITRVQIPSENGTEMVAVSPGALAVHSLAPYSGWEKFKPQIAEALKIFVSISNPKAIRRIGIRYINYIQPREEKPSPKEYFTAPPYELDTLGCSLDSFAQRYEYIYQDEPIKVMVNLARVAPPGKQLGFVLDLDVIREWPTDFLSINRAMAVVEDLRRREREAFESLITNYARQAFDE